MTGNGATGLVSVTGAEQALSLDIPSTYLAAHLAREDERMFAMAERRTCAARFGLARCRCRELAPDEVLIAVMASAINYNTVWSAMFEPIPTFRFLESWAQRRLGRAPRPAPPRHRIRRVRSGRAHGRGGAQLVGWRSRRGVSVRDRLPGPASQVDGMLAARSAGLGI